MDDSHRDEMMRILLRAKTTQHEIDNITRTFKDEKIPISKTKEPVLPLKIKIEMIAKLNVSLWSSFDMMLAFDMSHSEANICFSYEHYKTLRKRGVGNGQANIEYFDRIIDEAFSQGATAFEVKRGEYGNI